VPARRIALIPAAGGGSRFGGDLPKQYADLSGRPLLGRTIERIGGTLELDAIVVALAPDDTYFQGVGGISSGAEPLRCGGATRAETVANALAALAGRCDDGDWILVHDAARPCVPVEALQRLTAELADDAVGGLLAIPVADTLKREDRATPARVLRTEDRAGLWQAQTPQMFRCGLLVQALKDAKTAVTDESGAVEQMGLKPRLVAGSRENIKVTFPEDMKIAEAILENHRRRS